MKKALLLISSLLFLCSSLLAGGVLTLKQVKEQGLSELVVSHLDLKEPVKEALENVPGGFLLEQPILRQLDTLQENLMKRKDWTQFLDTAGLAFVQCVANEDAQLPDLDKQFSELLSADQEALFQNTDLNESEQKLLLQVLSHQLNLNTRLSQLADETRASLSTPAVLALQVVNIGMQAETLWLISAVMLCSFLIMLFSASRIYRALQIAAILLLTSALLFLCVGYVLPTISQITYLQAEELLHTAFQQLRQLGIWYLCASAVLGVLSVIMKISIRK